MDGGGAAVVETVLDSVGMVVAAAMAVLVLWLLGRWVRKWVVIFVPDKDEDGKPIKSFNPYWRKGNKLKFLLSVLVLVILMVLMGTVFGYCRSLV